MVGVTGMERGASRPLTKIMKKLLILAAMSVITTSAWAVGDDRCAQGRKMGEYFHPTEQYNNKNCFYGEPQKSKEKPINYCVHPRTHKILHVGNCTTADRIVTCVHPVTHKILHEGYCTAKDTIHRRVRR